MLEQCHGPCAALMFCRNGPLLLVCVKGLCRSNGSRSHTTCTSHSRHSRRALRGSNQGAPPPLAHLHTETTLVPLPLVLPCPLVSSQVCYYRKWGRTPYATRYPPHLHVPRVGTETQHTHHGHKGGGRGYMMCSPQGLSAGMDRQKVVMYPSWAKDPASGHPRAQKPPLGTSPPAWDDRLDARGQRQGQLPSSVWTRHRGVKQGKSRAPLAQLTKGKESREGKIGQGGRGRTQGGERPMGTTALSRKRVQGKVSEW